MRERCTAPIMAGLTWMGEQDGPFPLLPFVKRVHSPMGCVTEEVPENQRRAHVRYVNAKFLSHSRHNVPQTKHCVDELER